MHDNHGMILRDSLKLREKVYLTYKQSLPPAPNPLLDWSADLCVADRTQYIILSNSET